MTCKISRCNICGKYFNSKRVLREHIDKNHRITNSKIKSQEITKHAALSSSKKVYKLDLKMIE